MAIDIPRVPDTDLAFLRDDAPGLVPLYRSHPDISIITPSSPHYCVLHYEENECNTTVPLAMVFPATLDQLRIVVMYCTSQKPPIAMSIRGGGHDPHGRNAYAGALQLDLRLLKWAKRLSDLPLADGTYPVSVGPGVVALELQRFLDAEGLSAATGWVGAVGVTGWSCGGGYGLSAGLWGLGVDNVLGAKLLTPDGRIIDTDDDSELLWAVRGAGLGNFGVICEVRLRAHPKPRYLGGVMTYDWPQVGQVLTGFQRLCDEKLPHNFSGEMATSATETTGPVISILFTWICSTDADAEIEAGWAYHEKLKQTLGSPVADTVCETSILELHETLHRNLSATSHGYWYMNSFAIPRLAPELIEIIMRHPAPIGGASTIMFHNAHGRAIQPDLSASWAHRDQHFLCSPLGLAALDATAEQKEQARAWADKVSESIATSGLTSPMGYWSLTHPDRCDVVRFFGSETATRLTRLKHRLNPQGFFSSAIPQLSNVRIHSPL